VFHAVTPGPFESTFADASRALGQSAAAAAGDPLAEEVTALFDEWRRPVLRYLLACRLPAQDGEEILQDVFLALFRHLAAGRPRDNLRGWIFRVAHNQALRRRHRSLGAARQLTPLDEAAADRHADPSPDPEGLLAARQRRERLLSVVDALPERDRACLHLRAEGLRYREIAQVLGMSLGGVASSLARSIGRLARADER
jgi:RNA polymerase sigma-70 factor (ECF subfamily)